MDGQLKWSEVIDAAPESLEVVDALAKCYQVVNRHNKILVALSGGSDSDIMADMIIRCGGKEKSVFVFFNTGLEYEATKKQIKYLQERYGVEIQTIPPVKPIPICTREYGIPFWSKRVSELIERLPTGNEDDRIKDGTPWHKTICYIGRVKSRVEIAWLFL